MGYQIELTLGMILKEKGIHHYFITRWPASVKKFYAKVDRNDISYLWHYLSMVRSELNSDGRFVILVVDLWI